MTQRKSRFSARAHLGGEVRRTVLPSGLRVVTEQMPASRTASLGFYIDSGSRHESAGLHGASHFLEHVLFKGTPRREAEEISRAIESVGGDLNAYTAKEHTCFYARVLADDCALAVDVLTDMLTASRVLGREVEAERQVILDEIAMHADDPAETAHDLVCGHLFGDAGLGQPVIGSQQSITALNRRQIVGYWRRHYRPSSVVVSAAGAIDHDTLVNNLGTFVSGSQVHRRRLPALKTGQPAGAVLTHHRPLEQCTAILGYRGFGVFDDRRYAQGLLTIILGGGMASRLFVEVRERRGLTYAIDAEETEFSDTGLWSIDWQCGPDKLAEILILVRGCLEDIATTGVGSEELSQAKSQMRGQTILAYEGPGARMSRLGTAELLRDGRTLIEVLDHYDEVTAAEVQAEAARLGLQQPVLAVVGPRAPRRKLERILGLG